MPSASEFLTEALDAAARAAYDEFRNGAPREDILPAWEEMSKHRQHVWRERLLTPVTAAVQTVDQMIKTTSVVDDVMGVVESLGPDADLNNEATFLKMLFAGWLTGSARQFADAHLEGHTRIEPITDAVGNYTGAFTLTTRSGTKLRVDVTIEDEGHRRE